MLQNSVPDLPNLAEDRYENIFNVYQDEDNYYYYNLLQTVKIPTNLPSSLFTQYNVSPGDTLPFISYKLFGTINLWWIICHLNNIEDPTQILQPGSTLNIPNSNIIQEILTQINIKQ
jgi:LysM repeat protein